MIQGVIHVAKRIVYLLGASVIILNMMIVNEIKHAIYYVLHVSLVFLCRGGRGNICTVSAAFTIENGLVSLKESELAAFNIEYNSQKLQTKFDRRLCTNKATPSL